jgi:hypothetical protein
VVVVYFVPVGMCRAVTVAPERPVCPSETVPRIWDVVSWLKEYSMENRVIADNSSRFII